MEEYEKVLKRIEEAKAQKLNLLIPAIPIDRDENSLFIPVLETLMISTDIKNGKEIYKGSDDKHFRLHASALKKIANAGAVKWDSYQSGFIKANDKASVAFRTVGGVIKADGDLYAVAGYYDIDLDVLRENLVEQYEEKAKKWTASNEADWFNKKSAVQKKDYLAACISRDLRAKKQYIVQLCESGAKNRVIRELFQIKNEYTMPELERPFLVLRYKLKLDYKDNMVRQIIVQESIRAALGIFGGSSQLGLPAPPPALEAQFTTLSNDPNLAGYKEVDPEAPADDIPDSPSELNSQEADFIALDHEQQMDMLRQMAEKKGCTIADLKKKNPNWSKKDFYTFLSKTNDDIPY